MTLLSLIGDGLHYVFGWVRMLVMQFFGVLYRAGPLFTLGISISVILMCLMHIRKFTNIKYK